MPLCLFQANADRPAPEIVTDVFCHFGLQLRRFSENMSAWKRILLQSLGIGIGIGIGLALSLAGYHWYSSRPVPSKPWNSEAITAAFVFADTAGHDNHLRFLYILENHTDRDYRVNSVDLLLSAVVREKGSLSGVGDVKFLNDRIFLPAKEHVQVAIEMPEYGFSGARYVNDPPDERQKYRETVKKYVANSLPRLNGFAAFDETNRYRINFPNGWRSDAQE